MRHLFIPDTQVRPGVPTQHIEALGNYIEAKRPDKIIVAGDWWDCPTTSVHNSPVEQEGLRIADDIQAGNDAMDLLWKAVERRNRQVAGWKKKQYAPEKHFLYGNHEDHIPRYVRNNPQLEGLLSYDLFNLKQYGFIEHPFLQPVDIDGILYCHFFVNPMSGRSYGGMIETRIKNIGQSFTQGHAQSFKYGELEVANGKRRHGLVAGAFYLHNEDYKSPQGNHHWRGVIMKNEVRDGEYDIMKVSADYLLRVYL